MNARTEVPAYNPEEFAESEDCTHRDTQVPAFDVSLLARAADTTATESAFAPSDVPMLAALDSGSEAIDHRAAFLLLNVDGRSDFETVIRLSHVPEADARVALTNMLAMGIITIRGREAEAAVVRQKSGMWSRGPSSKRGGEHWTFAVR